MFCGILFFTIKDNTHDVKEKEKNTDNRGTFAA